MDRYEEALKALIAEKKKGHKPARVAEPEDTNVVDLMSALRASLSGKDKGAARPAARRTTKKAPAKSAARSRARKAG